LLQQDHFLLLTELSNALMIDWKAGSEEDHIRLTGMRKEVSGFSSGLLYLG